MPIHLSTTLTFQPRLNALLGKLTSLENSLDLICSLKSRWKSNSSDKNNFVKSTKLIILSKFIDLPNLSIYRISSTFRILSIYRFSVKFLRLPKSSYFSILVVKQSKKKTNLSLYHLIKSIRKVWNAFNFIFKFFGKPEKGWIGWWGWSPGLYFWSGRRKYDHRKGPNVQN